MRPALGGHVNCGGQRVSQFQSTLASALDSVADSWAGTSPCLLLWLRLGHIQLCTDLRLAGGWLRAEFLHHVRHMCYRARRNSAGGRRTCFLPRCMHGQGGWWSIGCGWTDRTDARTQITDSCISSMASLSARPSSNVTYPMRRDCPVSMSFNTCR